MIIFRFLTAFFSILSVSFISAQNNDYYLPSWELGIYGSAFVYQGDLTPNEAGSFKTMQPGVQVTAGKYFTNTIFVRAGITLATLRGNDHLYWKQQLYRYYRNYSFNATIAELNITGLGYFFNDKFYEQPLQPYLAGGVGLSFINTNPSSAATDFSFFPQSDFPARLSQDFQKANQRWMLSLISGPGLKYNINKKIAITAEGLYRFGFSDYIDGFSIAANNKENDHYYSVNVGMIFRFADYGLRSDIRKRLRCFW